MPRRSARRLNTLTSLPTNPKDLIGIKKPPIWLVPPPGLLHCAMAMKNGASKYGAYNWRGNAVKSSIYIDAAMRHLMAYLDGEDYATDSGVHHLGHAMACCAIILDAFETGNLVDDRPPKGKTPEIIERLTKEKAP
jgi:dATP/dGTP diphosphohydrolase, N-terminal